MNIKNVSKLTFLKITGIVISVAFAININNSMTAIEQNTVWPDRLSVTTVARDSLVIREHVIIRDSIVVVHDTLMTEPYEPTAWELYGPGPRGN